MGWVRNGVNQMRWREGKEMDKGDELLLLIALSGELPADWIGRSVGSDSYGAALLTRLKEDGMIKLRKRDGIR